MLFKNVLRDFKKRLIQVILLAVIVILSSFVYVVMTYSVSAMKGPTEEYFGDYRQEEFNVIINNQVLGTEFEILSLENTNNINTLNSSCL